jgi:hypothetical protein
VPRATLQCFLSALGLSSLRGLARSPRPDSKVCVKATVAYGSGHTSPTQALTVLTEVVAHYKISFVHYGAPWSLVVLWTSDGRTRRYCRTTLPLTQGAKHGTQDSAWPRLANTTTKHTMAHKSDGTVRRYEVLRRAMESHSPRTYSRQKLRPDRPSAPSMGI